MGASDGKSKGPPPAVKKLLGLFGSKREEDRMVGYLSFLKIGPKLLKFLPGMSCVPASRLCLECRACGCNADHKWFLLGRTCLLN